MPGKKGRKKPVNEPLRGDITLYRSADGAVQVECVLMEETLWLTQKAISELFGVEPPAISKHLSNIYETNELHKEATLSILETVQPEGSRNVRRKLEYYSLDAIIAEQEYEVFRNRRCAAIN